MGSISDASIEPENEEEEAPVNIELELPENLKRKLEEDCMNIKFHNKVTKH